MELGLRQRFVAEMCLRGHLSLQTTLCLQALPTENFKAMAASLHRGLRSGESPSRLRKLLVFTAQATTVPELCQAFWNLFPQGPDLEMMEMVLEEKQLGLFDALYDRLQPTTNDKALLLRAAIRKGCLSLALDLFGEVGLEANLHWWGYEGLTLYYIGLGCPDLGFLRLLIEVPARQRVSIDPEKYLSALLARGHQQAAFWVWELMAEFNLRVFNSGLLHRQAIKSCCLEFALELVPYTRLEPGYDWTAELASAGVSGATCLEFVKALADSEGRLEGEYRQLLGREVRYRLYGAAFLGQLLELASRYGWRPPFEALEDALLRSQAPTEYVEVLRSHRKA